MTPVEPPRTPWDLSSARSRPGDDLVAVGADLQPGTILAAYRCGLFPMGLGDGGAPPLGWWSPDPRGVLELHELRVSRSLRRSLRGFELTWDAAFDEVVAGCADPAREGAWITGDIAAAYGLLHRLGWAHSVEVWRDGELAGGLYGLALGGLFAGESMFHRRTDASKAALVGLVAALEATPGAGPRLVDVQWRTEHLASLGIREIARDDYLRRLPGLLAAPGPQLARDARIAPRDTAGPGPDVR